MSPMFYARFLYIKKRDYKLYFRQVQNNSQFSKYHEPLKLIQKTNYKISGRFSAKFNFFQ